MTDPRIHERRVSVARAVGRSRRRWIIAGLVVVLLGAGAVALMHSSLLGARHVEVTGEAHTTYSEVVRVAGLEGAPPLVDLSAQQIAAKVETLPWVDRATVTLSWPSTVRISLSERTPVAVVAAPGHTWALVDSTGRVLEILSSAPTGFPQIVTADPVPRQGGRFGASARSLAEVAAYTPEKMVGEIAGIRLAAHGIIVDLNSGLVALIGSPTELHDKFVALATVLAHGGLAEIGTIDLRVPSAPVLIRKDSSPIVARNVGG